MDSEKCILKRAWLWDTVLLFSCGKQSELLIGCCYGRGFSNQIIKFRGMADQKETVQEKDVTRKSGTDTDRSFLLYMSF